MNKLTTLTLILFTIPFYGQNLAHVQKTDGPDSISEEQIILNGYTWLTNTENLKACNPKEAMDLSIKPLTLSSSPSNDFMHVDHFKHNNALTVNVNLLDVATLQLKDSNGHVVFKTKLKPGRQQQTIFLDAYQTKSVIVSLITPTEVINKEIITDLKKRN